MLSRFMVELGYECSEAGHGKDALARLGEGPMPDVILCDWNMPEMNGLELVKAVRADARYADVKIVMATTETESSQVSDAMTAGANEYLMKPFTKESLQGKLGILGLATA